MICEHLERRSAGELYCRPKNVRCVEVPLSQCRELYNQQKEEAQEE